MVKSGYQLLRKLASDTLPSSASLHSDASHHLFSDIWKLNVPQKIKHFWWRSLHNALPTADNLRKRKIHADDTCQRCGESIETINHLLFECRISREIWEQAMFQATSGNFIIQNNFAQNLKFLQSFTKNQREDVSFFPFLGWRIWKTRNDLQFNNKRWSIPDTITKALLDRQQWIESLAANPRKPSVNQPPESRIASKRTDPRNAFKDIIHKANTYVCFVDGSWSSPTDYAGIGWVLYDNNAHFVLRGMAAINPMSSSLETEAEALRLAMLHVSRLGYKCVMFCGDALNLFSRLQHFKKDLLHPRQDHSSLSTYIADVMNLAGAFDRVSFFKISREVNYVLTS